MKLALLGIGPEAVVPLDHPVPLMQEGSLEATPGKQIPVKLSMRKCPQENRAGENGREGAMRGSRIWQSPTGATWVQPLGKEAGVTPQSCAIGVWAPG